MGQRAMRINGDESDGMEWLHLQMRTTILAGTRMQGTDITCRNQQQIILRSLHSLATLAALHVLYNQLP